MAALCRRNRGRLSRTIAGTVAQPSTRPDAKPSHRAAVVVACFAVCLYICVAAVIGRRFQYQTKPVKSVNSYAAATLHASALDQTAAALVAASSAVSRIAARDALDVSASALAVAAVVVAVDAEGLTPVPFAWIHDAVADATRERFNLDRAYASGLLTLEQHAVKRDAVRVRVRSAVAYANDGETAAVVVAFPDVAMHDATLTDCGVAFVRVAHPTADGVCGFVAGPAFRTRLPFADVAAAADYVANRPDVVRLPGERVAPSGSGRVARPAVSLPTIADV